jgi:hypothetical protein
LQNIYKEYAEIAAKLIAEEEPLFYFKNQMQESYPAFEKLAASTLIGISSDKFIEYKLYYKYPKMLEPYIDDYCKKYPISFFERKMDYIYPQYVQASAEKIIETNPG